MSEAKDKETAQTGVTRTFPPEQPKGLEAGVLRGLLLEAMKAYLELFKRTEPQTFGREVFRLQEKGLYGTDVKFPRYLWDHTLFQRELGRSELKNLLDYLWGRGEPAVTLSGPNPQRENWETWVLNQMVHPPVARALQDAAIDEAIDTGSVTLWRMPEDALEAQLDDVVLRWCHHKHRYLAKCPVRYLEIAPGEEWSLAEGIKLRGYTPRDVVGLLSRNHYQAHWLDLFASSLSDSLVVVEMNGFYDPRPKQGERPRTETDIVDESIADMLDMTKWAIMTVIGEGMPLKEGLITYDLASDVGSPIVSGRSFRRHTSTPTSGQV